MKIEFCDCCGAEVTDKNRFGGLKVEVSEVEIYINLPNAIPCDFDVCKYCVLDKISKLDDRPKDATMQAK